MAATSRGDLASVESERELTWESSVDAAAIGVSVKDGAVTLTGSRG
jgi:osmotically-inducible protein OsmY